MLAPFESPGNRSLDGSILTQPRSAATWKKRPITKTRKDESTKNGRWKLESPRPRSFFSSFRPFVFFVIEFPRTTNSAPIATFAQFSCQPPRIRIAFRFRRSYDNCHELRPTNPVAPASPCPCWRTGLDEPSFVSTENTNRPWDL